MKTCLGIELGSTRIKAVEVAVTEGDKVEVQAKLGWQVNTWAVGDLVKEMNAVTEAEIDELMETYKR